jgi:hypothetical protein
MRTLVDKGTFKGCQIFHSKRLTANSVSSKGSCSESSWKFPDSWFVVQADLTPSRQTASFRSDQKRVSAI